MRMPEVMRDQLRALAVATSEATGRKVTRSDVERSILADGIRRALEAPQYVARLAPEAIEQTKGTG